MPDLSTSRRSLNHNARTLPVSQLVLHYTGMPTAEAALARLCDVRAKVSAHYVVEENGLVHALVDETARAWHAGAGHWRGVADVNGASVGVEIVNPGHEWGYRAFPMAQMQAVAELCADILSRHAIVPQDVIGHSDIAPDRKQDPGELFDWQWLAEQGIGLWPKEKAGLTPVSGDDAPEALARYGYGRHPAPMLISAFQRHFRPHSLTGIWDAECGIRLAALLEQTRGSAWTQD